MWPTLTFCRNSMEAETLLRVNLLPQPMPWQPRGIAMSLMRIAWPRQKLMSKETRTTRITTKMTGGSGESYESSSDRRLPCPRKSSLPTTTRMIEFRRIDVASCTLRNILRCIVFCRKTKARMATTFVCNSTSWYDNYNNNNNRIVH